MSIQVGSYDAKTRLPELLREVQKGKQFTITHRGKPVADLVPSTGTARRDYRKAVEDMANFKRIKGIDPKEVAAWIREGRR
jgi:prevent-host-death family protein